MSSHSPAGSLFDRDVENAGNDRRWAGLHDDCRKLGFEAVDRGRKDDVQEARNTDRGTARAKPRSDSILRRCGGARDNRDRGDDDTSRDGN